MASSPRPNTSIVPISHTVSPVARWAAWVAILLTILAILLLASLHVLSPEFAPSWRMISEYAFGQYGWVLSLMFVCMGMGPWALAVAIWSQVPTRADRLGLWLLLVAGLGGVMASVFDIRHETGHGIAGLLGVFGFPIGAMLVSISLGRNKLWRGASRGLLWIANLSWFSVVLLVLTLAIMTMQVSKAYGGHLPQQAPKALPPGVLPLDGWADRLIVLSSCAWVLVSGYAAIALNRKQARHDKSLG